MFGKLLLLLLVLILWKRHLGFSYHCPFHSSTIQTKLLAFDWIVPFPICLPSFIYSNFNKNINIYL